MSAAPLMRTGTSFFNSGVFDRFPRVKVVVLESQASWIGYLLDRMDSVYKGSLRSSTALKDLPSIHFRRQCWISADPDERALQTVIDFVGGTAFSGPRIFSIPIMGKITWRK